MHDSNLIGLDLAKNVIQVCKIDKNGELISNKAISPKKLRELLAKSTPSIVAMEGCGGCHYWARLAESYGHEARIISPKKVKGYLQGQKTDANDAIAIAVAATQVGMRYSQIKKEVQQSLQTLDTTRRFLIRDLAALDNHIRAYLYEYGITVNKGRKSLGEIIPIVLDDNDMRLPQCLRSTLSPLWERYTITESQLKVAEKSKAALVKQLEPCKRLLDLESGKGVSRLIDSYADGYLTKGEFEPRIRTMKARLQHIDEQRNTIIDQQALKKDLHCIITNLETFANQVHSSLSDIGWEEKRAIIRMLVKKVEIDLKEVNVVFKVSSPLTPGKTGTKTVQDKSLQDCCRGNFSITIKHHAQ